METSILNSTKKILGLAADYTAFDLDISTHINTALSQLTQLGIGPSQGFTISDDTAKWDDFLGPDNQLEAAKSFVYLRVRLLFDPPLSSYLISAFEKQLEEIAWRLSTYRESIAWVDPNPVVVEDEESGETVRIESIDGGFI